MIFRRTKREIVAENPKGGITENFGRIQRGDHSNLLGKWRRILGGRNLVRVRNIVVAAIFDFMTVGDWRE